MTLQQVIQHAERLLHTGQLLPAETFTRQMLAQTPTQPQLRELLGIILMQIGLLRGRQNEYDLATARFFEAQDYRPLDADIQNNLGAAYILKGRYT